MCRFAFGAALRRGLLLILLHPKAQSCSLRIAERAEARNAKAAILLRPFVLAANAKALDYAFVTRLIAALDVVQKFPA